MKTHNKAVHGKVMSLEQEIVSWDGKSSSDIDAIYTRHCEEDSFASKMIELSQKLDLQKGTTWLLKRHLGPVHTN